MTAVRDRGGDRAGNRGKGIVDAEQFQGGNRLQIQKQGRQSPIAGVVGLLILLIVLLLGVYFRGENLGDRVYWVDEVATSIRIAGTTRTQLVQQLATGQLLTVQQLLDVQQFDPALPWSATFAALRQSPEHAPLYFLLARLWLQLWGNGIAQIRSLSVLFSLLCLPALFWLSQALFQSRRTSTIAVMLLSVSPFFVAYAQEARPYSLWGLSLLWMAATLLSALRRGRVGDWLLYAGAATIALYTSVLTLLVLIGQGIYAALTDRMIDRMEQQKTGVFQRWLLAAGGAMLLFSPWIIMMLQHWAMLQDNTTWARIPLSPIAMVAIWLYSVVVLFFDLPVSVSLSFETIAKAFTALFILIFIGVSLNSLRRSSRSVWQFLLTFALPIPIALMLVDFLSQGQASATPRYLVPLQLSVLLVMSRWLSDSFQPVPCDRLRIDRSTIDGDRFLRFLKPSLLILLMSLSLMSCISNLNRIPDYQKAHNRFNPPIAALINQANRPLIVSEAANTMNLLSLSHSLLPDISLQIFPVIDASLALNVCNPNFNTTFLFNPTPDLIDRLRASAPFTLQAVYQPDLLTPDDVHLSLWQIRNGKIQSGQIQNPPIQDEQIQSRLWEQETAR